MPMGEGLPRGGQRAAGIDGAAGVLDDHRRKAALAQVAGKARGRASSMPASRLT
jgi:hypothetical protein